MSGPVRLNVSITVELLLIVIVGISKRFQRNVPGALNNKG